MMTTMRLLNDNEAEAVAGGGPGAGVQLTGELIVCAGSVGSIVVTDGAVSPWVGAIAIGSCTAFVAGLWDMMSPSSVNLVYDGSVFDNANLSEHLTY